LVDSGLLRLVAFDGGSDDFVREFWWHVSIRPYCSSVNIILTHSFGTRDPRESARSAREGRDFSVLDYSGRAKVALGEAQGRFPEGRIRLKGWWLGIG
jgi:hypothetical protein